MLRLSRVTKVYNDFTAIRDVNLEVEDGLFLCVIGRTGCGKTTLLRMIAGLDAPTDGEISFNGERTTGPSPERGFVFQEYVLFPWRTVEKNIEFGLEVKGMGREEREKLVKRYIELVGLKGFEKYLPKELSGGMKQRVAIARALVNDPKILLMDEPFGALDAQTRNKMQEELLRIWEKEHKTVIFVTHNVDEALFLADRIVVMACGPGRVEEVLDVKLPRPRLRTSPEVNALRDRILRLL